MVYINRNPLNLELSNKHSHLGVVVEATNPENDYTKKQNGIIVCSLAYQLWSHTQRLEARNCYTAPASTQNYKTSSPQRMRNNKS